MVTIGSQASGETGLKIWISGLSAGVDRRRQAAEDAERHRDERRDHEADEDGLQDWSQIWSIEGRRAGVGADA